jgi:hypothetical protein
MAGTKLAVVDFRATFEWEEFWRMEGDASQ